MPDKDDLEREHRSQTIADRRRASSAVYHFRSSCRVRSAESVAGSSVGCKQTIGGATKRTILSIRGGSPLPGRSLW